MTTWQVGSHCIVYCESDNKWYDDGFVARLNSKYVSIVFKNETKHKRMKIQSTAKYLAPINEQNLKLKKGSHCFIYSISAWCKGRVIDIYDPYQTGEEWLMVQYKDENGVRRIEDVRRHSAFINAVSDGQLEKIEKQQRETNIETFRKELQIKVPQKYNNYISPESTAEPEPLTLGSAATSLKPN